MNLQVSLNFGQARPEVQLRLVNDTIIQNRGKRSFMATAATFYEEPWSKVSPEQQPDDVEDEEDNTA